MQYIMFYLSYYTENSGMIGGRTITTTLNYGIIVIVIFSIIFLNYSNSFLLRRRQKEFGIYNILGMSKKNITHIYLWENIIIYLISTVFGITIGIAFSKFAELLLTRLIKDNISYDFTINKDLILVCAAVSAFVFLLLFVRGVIALWKLNTLSLMKSEKFRRKTAESKLFDSPYRRFNALRRLLYSVNHRKALGRHCDVLCGSNFGCNRHIHDFYCRLRYNV